MGLGTMRTTETRPAEPSNFNEVNVARPARRPVCEGGSIPANGSLCLARLGDESRVPPTETPRAYACAVGLDTRQVSPDTVAHGVGSAVSSLPSIVDPLEAAARVLARQDRGCTTGEADEIRAWVQASPGNALALASIEHAWRRLDQLHVLCPRDRDDIDPDLLLRIDA